jgi:hypothetical protein
LDDYEDITMQVNSKSSLAAVKKPKIRRKSFEQLTPNEFKRMKKASKPMDLKFGRNMKYLLDFNNKPHKMILTKEYRDHIWRFLLLSNNELDDN